ncbi:SRPBCC family protein [Pedobacter agri]|uniref:SRPBCC family protein n=1 Tax=Pedobacter agri TaxID=454586 RepID=UPI002930A73B|nr:SRPBCC family protein [Pedobacter agri]
MARSIDLHVYSMKFSKEEVIAGRTYGLINLNETVTWKANHFGINFTMTSKITAMEKPYCFTDEMIKGPFRKLHHQHLFKSLNSGTEMTDIFEFEAPLGALGKLIERIILKNYMKNLLAERNNVIKKEAETCK